MAEHEAYRPASAVEQQSRLVRRLQAAVYTRSDPSADESLYQELLAAEAKLQELNEQLGDAESEDEGKATEDDGASPPDSSAYGRFLGPETTKLSVKPELQMNPLPTGIYHLLDPEKEPLVEVFVKNHSVDPRRVCVKTYIEGLSAQAVRTVELDARKSITLKLSPVLLPERALYLTEIQRATLHVVAEDLDRKPESHDTFPIICLARTSSFNTVRRPGTRKTVDLTHYYGAWVTPHVEPVQKMLRRAAELLSVRQVWGYQGEPDSVTQQVEAIYKALAGADIVYINSVIDYGAPAGYATQRTRLPSESISGQSANCIDGTVLMASLIEAASLNPAIVIVPGHAFVAWETWEDSDEWHFLETTMIGTHDFEAAVASGLRQYKEHKKATPRAVKFHRVLNLRADGIWPME